MLLKGIDMILQTLAISPSRHLAILLVLALGPHSIEQWMEYLGERMPIPRQTSYVQPNSRSMADAATGTHTAHLSSSSIGTSAQHRIGGVLPTVCGANINARMVHMSSQKSTGVFAYNMADAEVEIDDTMPIGSEWSRSGTAHKDKQMGYGLEARYNANTPDGTPYYRVGLFDNGTVFTNGTSIDLDAQWQARMIFLHDGNMRGVPRWQEFRGSDANPNGGSTLHLKSGHNVVIGNATGTVAVSTPFDIESSDTMATPMAGTTGNPYIGHELEAKASDDETGESDQVLGMFYERVVPEDAGLVYSLSFKSGSDSFERVAGMHRDVRVAILTAIGDVDCLYITDGLNRPSTGTTAEAMEFEADEWTAAAMTAGVTIHTFALIAEWASAGSPSYTEAVVDGIFDKALERGWDYYSFWDMYDGRSPGEFDGITMDGTGETKGYGSHPLNHDSATILATRLITEMQNPSRIVESASYDGRVREFVQSRRSLPRITK